MNPKYIIGKYRLDYQLMAFKNQRICATIGIFKGDTHVGILFYHVDAKQIVLHTFGISLTSSLMKFALPFTDMRAFICSCRVLKVKQDRCTKHGEKRSKI